ncbi:1895_t:CDS:2 [Entrophospora sp. SA101]|nr:471_t:CDS:2 [Entrophospora sp. SA101]CAJ0753643.1 24112_t:CDS:2 [Entrophospora sp. SA101]CAJ0765309.1 1895_t:CDS:2 [Entrophospora sp. SA101]CAJ0833126.1 13356_t:CDS:2 [Entrophospora sp. SA101]CAJ0905900.1 10304_t:CDS:2 [Entrophospora sp. SA101]
MPLPLLFIPKNRKANFDIEITIEELLNVPSITGLYYVKWKFKHRGELNGGKEISNIGRLKINLSEYVGSTIITRHFLLRESKVNSTLKNLFYFRPPLKKTQIFNGIAGMISGHNEQQDDERSKVGLNTAHYITKSKSTSSLRSAYYAQANHTTPITSSLATNHFLLNIDSKSPIDVIEEIFMGNDPNNEVDVNDQHSISEHST